MTVRERLAQLVGEGAALQVRLPGHAMVVYLLAAISRKQSPTRLRWCAVFPEHQGHVHETAYDRAELVAGGRDVAFYRGDHLVLYVCPYAEAEHEIADMRELWDEWTFKLGQFNNAERFDEFFELA